MTDPLPPADRERLEDLFARAATLPPSEHAGFVERECGPDGALRARLERLLAGHLGEDHLTRIKGGAPLRPGTEIGPYKLLERIGEGGMGEVYEAEQLRPVARRVALKVIKPGMDSSQVVARFEAERQALARMTHPHIAQVYDAGTTDAGRPYFVMEFVAGQPITDFCDHHRLTTDRRLELFLEVCAGVQHAHQKGVIHRDLKPSNLLVTRSDSGPIAKIIDFGVARATTGRLAERTLHTMIGQIVGTLDYMSPEQADPTGLDIDTRSDVYSLGVVLYQLVCGLLPTDSASAVDRPLSDVLRAIRETDVPAPSSRLRRQGDAATTLAPRHGTDQRALVRRLTGDLDWICLKALEKDPDRRYQSAAELAADVRRHLANLPVLAGRPGLSYRVGKFVRRNRAGVAAALLVAAAATTGLVGLATGIAAEQVKNAQRPYADAHLLRQLERRADEELWPPHPDKIQALVHWLAEARALAATLPDHAADLEAMRARARPAAAAPPAFRFATAADQSRHDTLTQLVAGLSALVDGETGLLGEHPEAASPVHGWSVPRRLAFARQLRTDFDEAGGRHAKAWRRALPQIHATYPGLRLEPQIGLVPLGPDPDTGYHLFAHLMTGVPATIVKGAEGTPGRVVLSEATGVVLVLIPADIFEMGGQGRRQTPVRRVKLSAHFLSKYEMTQGQWKRLTGTNPSRYGPDGVWDPAGEGWLDEKVFKSTRASLLHPVEQVSWWDCKTWLGNAGLALPSEAQWEHGARGSTSPPPRMVDQGDDPRANLSDAWASKHGGTEHAQPHMDLDDGSTMHAPVDSYGPNPLGLYNVRGNVYEWCLDGFDGRFYGRPGQAVPDPDPVAPWNGDEPRVHRGGSYRSRAGPASAAVRSYYPPAFRGHALGVRPGRAIEE